MDINLTSREKCFKTKENKKKSDNQPTRLKTEQANPLTRFQIKEMCKYVQKMTK